MIKIKNKIINEVDRLWGSCSNGHDAASRLAMPLDARDTNIDCKITGFTLSQLSNE